MPSWGWTVLKWTAAIAVMAVVVYISVPLALEQLEGAVSFGDDDEGELIEPIEGDDEAPIETPELLSGEARGVAVGAAAGALLDPAAVDVTIGPGAAAALLVAFEPLPFPTACLDSLTLELPLLESTETSVYVLPARVPELRDMAAGANLPADWELVGVEPSRAFTNGTPGGLRWDVQDAFTLAAAEVDEGADVTLSITTPDADPERATTFATGAEMEERRPLLQWEAIAGCADLGPDGSGTTADEGTEDPQPSPSP